MFVVVMIVLGSVAMLYRWKVGLPVQGRNLSAWSSYDAPHVWLFAICIVAFFALRVYVPEWLSRVVTVISPSMFGVYLMHHTTSFGRLLYRIPQEWLMAQVSLHPALVVFLSAVVCFVLCVGADVLRRFLLRCISGPIKRLLSFVDARWDAYKVRTRT